jgi:hypothetical protein
MEASSANRIGLILLAFLLAISFSILAYRENLPRQESLSSHSFVPQAFGKIQSSHRAQGEPTHLGYAYSISKAAVPEQYDKTTHPWISEPGGTVPLDTRFLRIHKYIELDKSSLRVLESAVNNSVQTWFYQGQIVAVNMENQVLLNSSLAYAGFELQRTKYLIYAGLALFTAAFVYLWPRLSASYRSFFSRKRFL